VSLFNTILKQPLFNVLIGLYEAIPFHDLGVAIIILTLLIRLLLYPLAAKALHSQRTLQSLQPEINKLREKHKGDSAEMNKAIMELYKEKEINPFSSCLPTLVQLPFLFALYLVFIAGLNMQHIDLLYSFVPKPHSINPNFLGLIDLSRRDTTFVLPVLAAALQFFQARMLLPKQVDAKDPSQALGRQLTYFMPVITFVFALSLPAALPLYWVTTTVFSIFQQRIIMGHDIEVIETPAPKVASAKPEKDVASTNPKPKEPLKPKKRKRRKKR
jgi:YidC/Oxa1 family membrane protein insertase